MSTKLENIDLLRQRSNISYEEAKDVLEKNNEDLLEALIYLEREKKTKSNENNTCKNAHATGYGFINSIKKLIDTGNKTKFQVIKSENIILSISVTVLVLITIFAPYITIVAAIIALFTSHIFKFVKADGSEHDFNKAMDKVSHAVEVVKVNLTKDENKAV